MPLFKIAITCLLIVSLSAPLLGGEPPGDQPAGPPAEQPSEPGAEPAPEDAGPQNGRTAEEAEFSLGEEGSAQLKFADGTVVTAEENARAKVSREKKEGALWSFLGLEEGSFHAEAQGGPVEYILPGVNLLGAGTSFDVSVTRVDKIELVISNQGPGSLVATDTLGDMQVLLSENQGIKALVDPGGAPTLFQTQEGNQWPVTIETGGGRREVGPGEAFESEGGGRGSLREEVKGRINTEPPTEMVEYLYTVDTGFEGKAKFTFRDRGHAYISEETSVSLSVVKRKEGEERMSMVNLEGGEVRFDLGPAALLLKTSVVTVQGRGAVFFAEAREGFDRFRNLRGEPIRVRAKQEKGPLKEGLVSEVKPGMSLLVKHGPDVEGIVFEVPEEASGEMVFRVRGKTLRMPAGGTLRFGETGSTVTVSVPTPEEEFTAIIPLGEAIAAPLDAALHDSGDLVETKNVSP